MKTFREYAVYRLMENEMYRDEDIINFMPGDVEQKISQITDDDLLQSIVAYVKKEVNQAYQDYVARKASSPDIDAIWRKYADVKSQADLQAMAKQAVAGKAAAKPLQAANVERETKTQIWNALIQKLAQMGGKPAPMEIMSLLNNTNRRRDFETMFVAKDAFSNTRAVGGQTDVFMPFYKDGTGAVKVSPNFASQRYPEWPKFLSDVIENTPLQVLQKVFRRSA
jgi:hypothetical protein